MHREPLSRPRHWLLHLSLHLLLNRSSCCTPACASVPPVQHFTRSMGKLIRADALMIHT